MTASFERVVQRHLLPPDKGCLEGIIAEHLVGLVDDAVEVVQEEAVQRLVDLLDVGVGGPEDLHGGIRGEVDKDPRKDQQGVANGIAPVVQLAGDPQAFAQVLTGGGQIPLQVFDLGQQGAPVTDVMQAADRTRRS